MKILKRGICIALCYWLPATLVTGQDAHGDHGHEHARGQGQGHDEHAGEVRLAPEAIRRHGIKVEPARRHRLAATFTAPGRVAFNAEAMAHVGSVLRGRIVEMNVKVGDPVRKSDALFIIESPELAEAQSDFLLKRAEAQVAVAAIEPLRQAHERARSLHEKSEGVALAEVQKRQAEYQAAQGRLAAAKAAATAAENKLHILGMEQAAVEKLAQTGEVNSRSSVRAPIDGRVIQREVTLGELVNPDRDALLVLADMTTLWVVADVSEGRLGDVSVGSPALVQLAALAQQPPLDGQISYIAPSLNPETRTVSVRIEVPNPDGLLRPGMFARAEISVTEPAHAEAALAVPMEAVLSIEGEPSIFVPVEGEENTFARRSVKVGKPIGRMVPVIEGLSEGQPLVTGGTFILKAQLGKSGAGHQH